MADTSVSIHSSVLAESIRKSAAAFDSYRKTIDSMTSDIRAVDKFLNDQGVKIQHWMRCEGLNEKTKDKTFSYELNWFSQGNSGYRIRARIRHMNVPADKEPWTILADMTLEERMTFFPYLAKFVDGLAAKARSLNPAPPAPEQHVVAAANAIARKLLEHAETSTAAAKQ